MNDRDKINALWLTLAMTMNALEQMGENVMVNDTDTDDYSVSGASGRVRWNGDAKQWELTQPVTTTNQ